MRMAFNGVYPRREASSDLDVLLKIGSGAPNCSCLDSDARIPQAQNEPGSTRECRRHRGQRRKFMRVHRISLIAGGLDQWPMVSILGLLVMGPGWSSASRT